MQSKETLTRAARLLAGYYAIEWLPEALHAFRRNAVGLSRREHAEVYRRAMRAQRKGGERGKSE